MRKKYSLDLEIPEGIICELVQGEIIFRKDRVMLEKKAPLSGISIKIENNKLRFICNKANRKNIAVIKAYAAHINNILKGLGQKFLYELEICHVHFPTTVKVEGNKVLISNFLGEKVNRKAEIREGVEVEVNGNKIFVSGNDIEKAGQTAANIEKATKIKKRDRRVYQDGIYLVSRPGGAI